MADVVHYLLLLGINSDSLAVHGELRVFEERVKVLLNFWMTFWILHCVVQLFELSISIF